MARTPCTSSRTNGLRYYDPNLVVATVGHLCSIRHPALVLFAATTTGVTQPIRLALERPMAVGALRHSTERRDIRMDTPWRAKKLHAIIGRAPGRVWQALFRCVGFTHQTRALGAGRQCGGLVPERSGWTWASSFRHPRTLDIAARRHRGGGRAGMGSRRTCNW